MKKVIFAFIVLLALMAAVVVMWGEINKTLKNLDPGRKSELRASSPATPGA
ncbi:MAG TPA: hypothetical protein VGK94_11010 [Candidatus Polarisedimenticolia bacterium]|jgi:hypothetical protein